MRRRLSISWQIIFVLLLISGCAPAFRVSPFLRERIQNAQAITLMAMDVEVYKVSAGGVQELVDEFSEEAKENIRLSLREKFNGGSRFKIGYFPEEKDIEDLAVRLLLKDTLALFKAVDFSIISHTYVVPDMVIHRSGVFPDKLTNFDYTLGPQISPLSEYAKADLFLFLRGGDYLSSGGRVALMVWVALLGGTPMNAGPPHLSASLVDAKTGEVLWYNFLCPPSGYNFRNRESVEKFMAILLKDFPQK